MKTVGDFRKAGLVFVVGDVVDHSANSDGSEIASLDLAWCDHCNRGTYGFNESPIGSFAWRANTGVMPRFNGLVELKHDDGETYKVESRACDWSQALCAGWTGWRPSLNQGGQVSAMKLSHSLIGDIVKPM